MFHQIRKVGDSRPPSRRYLHFTFGLPSITVCDFDFGPLLPQFRGTVLGHTNTIVHSCKPLCARRAIAEYNPHLTDSGWGKVGDSRPPDPR